jgi:hypothetical protein
MLTFVPAHEKGRKKTLTEDNKKEGTEDQGSNT